LKHWLEGRSVADARVIASRAALRVLPLIWGMASVVHDQRRSVAVSTFSIFGASALAWASSRYPTQTVERVKVTAVADYALWASVLPADADSTQLATALTRPMPLSLQRPPSALPILKMPPTIPLTPSITRLPATLRSRSGKASAPMLRRSPKALLRNCWQSAPFGQTGFRPPSRLNGKGSSNPCLRTRTGTFGPAGIS
jgi:hypothetical protein